MNRLNSKIDLWAFISFLSWPFFTLLFTLKKPLDVKSKYLALLFCGFFGTSIAVNLNEDNDINRYLESFYEFQNINFSFSNLNEQLLTDDNSGYKDLLFPLIAFSVAKLGLNKFWFLFVLGFSFGLFYVNSIWFLISEIYSKKRSSFILILLITFALIVPIWRGVNGFRFAMATIMCLYALINYFFKEKVFSPILIILILPLVHFSTGSISLIFFLYVLIKQFSFINTLFFIYLSTALLSNLSLDTYANVLAELLPSYLAPKLGYINEEYSSLIDANLELTSWYAIYFNLMLNYSSTLIFIIAFWFRKILRQFSEQVYSLLVFGLLYGIFSNIIYHIPSGSRFMLIHNFVAILVFSILYANGFFENHLKSLSKYFNFIKFSLIFYCVIQFWIGLESISLLTFFGNPILTYLMDSDLSIKSLLK